MGAVTHRIDRNVAKRQVAAAGRLLALLASLSASRQPRAAHREMRDHLLEARMALLLATEDLRRAVYQPQEITE